MKKCVDDKKYATDPRMFRDVVMNDINPATNEVYFKNFIESPIIDRMEINDVCVYGPTDLNKIKKIGRTSWDSFAYALLMGHNVYAHIKAVQDGNERYDNNIIPGMLLHDLKPRYAFRQLVDAIFSAKTFGEAMKLVDEEERWYREMPGSSANGMLGKKTMNSNTMARELCGIEAQPKIKPEKKEPPKIMFTSLLFEGDDVEEHPRDDSGLDESLLDELEESEQ
jgi:hypothetical protein